MRNTPVNELTAQPRQAELDAPGSIVLFARQPILEATGALQGYELLFRRPDGTGWPVDDEERATAHVLVSALADLSLSAVTDGTRAWINLSRDFVFDDVPTVLPVDRVVLELLERNEVDADYVARVAELADAGYEIALDDFTWSDEMEPLVRLATYVKLDLRELGIDGIEEYARRLAPYGVRLVAEKVETAEERDACLAAGFQLFQGYFFERPRLVRGRPAPPSALGRLRTATALGPDSTFEDVEQLVMLDPGLSVRLLRYINSAALSTRSTIGSLRHALMLLGANAVRQWILLVLLGELGHARPAVLSAGLVRAKLCEIIAGDAGLDAAESAFIVGLLSICDALLDSPLDEVIEGLPLTPEVSGAILRREGRLGEILDMAIALQHGEDVPADAHPEDALLRAIQWADAQLSGLAG